MDYSKIYHQGISVTEWVKKLGNNFTPSEVLKLVRDGTDLFRFAMDFSNNTY